MAGARGNQAANFAGTYARLCLVISVLLVFSCSQKPAATARTYSPDLSFPKFSGVLGRAAFAPLPLGCVKPRGWLLEQLRIQAEGLSGHIEEIWPDLGPNNAWRGGKGEAWERGPYYLDGMVPLAFLLDDPGLEAKVQIWIDWNLEHQHPDGSLGPSGNGDWWPDMVFLKALLQYAEASGDTRVGPFLDRYFHYLKQNLPQQRLDDWKRQQGYDQQGGGVDDLVGDSNRWQYYRWTEMVLSLLWQYRQAPNADLLETAEALRNEGYDWEENFKDLPFKQKSGQDQIFLVNHGVNNAMGMKADALDWLLEGRQSSLQEAAEPLRALNQWHGQANGAFSADEQLAGLDPSQGTELCSVVEEMFSLETMLWISGDPSLGDALERLAFNALPAALSEDCWRHQYDQQVNQIEVSTAQRQWTNNGPHANLFGLEPQWGCCTSNYHQGWPKFVEHLWMATQDGGLAVMSYAPAQVEIILPSGNHLKAECSGDYPFSGNPEIKFSLDQSGDFPLRLRIPAWVAGGEVRIGDQTWKPVAGRFLEIQRHWNDGDVVKIRFDMPTKVKAWGPGNIVMRGPLLFAMNIVPKENDLGPEAWSDEELYPTEAWNLAPKIKPGEDLSKWVKKADPVPDRVFDWRNPVLSLRIPARTVENWEMEEDSAGPIPLAPRLGGPEGTALLIPYAAAKLRVTVFPKGE